MSSRTEFVFDQVALRLQQKNKDIGSLAALLDSLALADASVLEVGCGMGDNLIYCMLKGASYAEGFDLSGESINVAQQKAAQLKDKDIRFYRCDLKDFKSERKFDYVLAWGVFEYLDDPLESLRKISKSLKDTGTLLVLISKPIFIKKMAFLLRLILSRIPRRAVLPSAKALGSFFKAFKPWLVRWLYLGESKTYTLEQTILESVMVPRYNMFLSKAFTKHLSDEGFSVRFFDGVTPSMLCIVAQKKPSQ